MRNLPALVAVLWFLAFILLSASASAQSPATECVPNCRGGYVCVQGSCVSACNPPCASGESCVNAECVAAVPPPAAAAPPPAPQPAAAPPAAAAPATLDASPAPPPAAGTPGGRTHDGFYFRAGIGAGGGSLAGSIADSDPAWDGAGVGAKGVAIPVELSFGGTVAPGLVIGGGSFGAVLPAPDATANNYGAELEGSGGAVTLSSIGPFVDYYFDPSQGLHAQAGIAFAVVAAARGDDPGANLQLPPDDYSGTGWSSMAGLGWEAWVGEQSSLGVLGRIQFGGATLQSNDSDASVDANFLFLSMLATYTYH